MSDWLDHLLELNGTPGVLVTVAETKGSTPRETGTKMLVTQQHCHGTIGGGNLEFKAIEIARALLAGQNEVHTSLRRFPLGPSLGQCCGGLAVLMFEPIRVTPDWVEYLRELRRGREPVVMITRTGTGAGTAKLIVGNNACFGGLGDRRLEGEAIRLARGYLVDRQLPPHPNPLPQGGEGIVRAEDCGCQLFFEIVRPADFHIVLFGAGHVGKALIDVLRGLPCTIDWVDSREDQFPDSLPANVSRIISEEPEYAVDDTPADSYFLIMTHSHPLDQAICERVLRRGDFRYCGLIGSATKRARFEHRLQANGLSKQQLQTLTCPIGVDGISGKHPLEIAIAVAAELLQVRERSTATLNLRSTAAA
jgi:xanthine dehydrogenase accessory factor